MQTLDFRLDLCKNLPFAFLMFLLAIKVAQCAGVFKPVSQLMKLL